MRFRPRFGPSGYFWLAALCFFVYILVASFAGSHHSVAMAAVLATLAAMQIAAKLFVLWDLGPNGVRERRMWRTREIPWDEITRVGPFSAKRRASPAISIEYARTGPLSERGQIVADPAEWDAFVAALRRYAPQAEIEL